MNAVYLKRSDEVVRKLADLVGYKGTNIKAIPAETVTFHGTNWDEGRRREYTVVRLADFATMSIEEAPFTRGEGDLYKTAHKIDPGFVVVVYVFMGQREGMEIITPAANITPLLEAKVELSDDEKTVLIATRSRKSSYGGVKDYRFQEAKRYRGITRERWDAAVASCKARKLLNAAGAITTEGRNAVGSESL